MHKSSSLGQSDKCREFAPRPSQLCPKLPVMDVGNRRPNDEADEALAWVIKTESVSFLVTVCFLISLVVYCPHCVGLITVGFIS